MGNSEIQGGHEAGNAEAKASWYHSPPAWAMLQRGQSWGPSVRRLGSEGLDVSPCSGPVSLPQP